MQGRAARLVAFLVLTLCASLPATVRAAAPLAQLTVSTEPGGSPVNTLKGTPTTGTDTALSELQSRLLVARLREDLHRIPDGDRTADPGTYDAVAREVDHLSGDIADGATRDVAARVDVLRTAVVFLGRFLAALVAIDKAGQVRPEQPCAHVRGWLLGPITAAPPVDVRTALEAIEQVAAARRPLFGAFAESALSVDDRAAVHAEIRRARWLRLAFAWGIATVLGVSTLYLGNATWGNTGDTFAAFLWGLGLSQVTYAGMGALQDRLGKASAAS